MKTVQESLPYDLNCFKLEGDALKQFEGRYENLVFEGGGIRGIAFGGVLKFFEDHGLLKGIKRFAGSSAGAIVAAAVAVGYTGSEIISILTGTDFNQFKDDSWGVVLDAYRFLSQYGIYKGDKLFDFFKKLIKDKKGDENFTFKQLYDQTGIELVITGTCLNKASTYYFHYLKWPDMPIALATRISMSIPLVYKAIKINTQSPQYDENGNVILDCDGSPQLITTEDVMVDGGLLNNYPIWVFDGKTLGDNDIDADTMQNSKTLGFKLMSQDEKRDSTLYYYNSPIHNIIDYMRAFVDSMTIQIERGHIRKGYWDKTVSLNTGNIYTLDFSITPEQKEMLVKTAYEATKNHFYCKLNNLPNVLNEIN